jgi:hypothetical protein
MGRLWHFWHVLFAGQRQANVFAAPNKKPPPLKMEQLNNPYVQLALGVAALGALGGVCAPFFLQQYPPLGLGLA